MSRANRGTEPSLIPTVKQAEARLLTNLAETESQARQIVEDAQKTAAERIDEAKRRLPALVQQAVDRGLEDARTAAHAISDSCKHEIASLERAAGERSSAAVDMILSKVLPGATA